MLCANSLEGAHNQTHLRSRRQIQLRAQLPSHPHLEHRGSQERRYRDTNRSSSTRISWVEELACYVMRTRPNRSAKRSWAKSAGPSQVDSTAKTATVQA